jgi:putative ABC transport system substrate-binding protein
MMINRRSFVAAAGAVAVAPPMAASAKALAKRPVVGFLSLASWDDHRDDRDGFREGLREYGQVEGRTLTIEERYADGKMERSGHLINDLIQRDVAVFVTPGPSAARAICSLTTRIPVVAVGLPSSNGYPNLFESLAHPGGNVTGFSHVGPELAPKRVQILREAVPSLASIAILYATTDSLYRDWAAETQAAVAAQGMETIMLGLTSPSRNEAHSLIERARAGGSTGLFIVRDFITEILRSDIALAAKSAGIAVVSEHRNYAQSGALLSYGARIPDLFRGAAGYVAQILKGANPADLPIQLPTSYELVINLKTANALGLTVSGTLLDRADDVIE